MSKGNNITGNLFSWQMRTSITNVWSSLIKT